MSLQQLIRDAMAAAGDAMKAGEIREAVGPEDNTSEQVGAALYALEKSGAIEKHGERGTYRYHLVPGWKPRQHSGGGKKKQPGAKVKAKAERRAAPATKVINVVNVAEPGAGVLSEGAKEALAAAIRKDTENPRAGLLVAGVDALPAAGAAEPEWPFETVMLQRRAVRALVAAVLERDGPLPPELRRAVLEATEAAA